jgi:hypothetical protein
MLTIEMTDRLAHVLIDVQDVLTKHGLEIGDLPCGAMWQELVGVAVNKVNEDFPLTHPTFNVKGTQTGRFQSKTPNCDPNIMSRVQGFS